MSATKAAWDVVRETDGHWYVQQTVTVPEVMPDLEAEIPCDDSGCQRVATERSLIACSGCGRISDVICHAHGNGLRRAMAENRKLEHRPCGWRSCAVLAVVPL